MAVLILAAYSNSFGVPFLLDDADSIALNESLRSFSTALFPPSESGITVSGRPLLNLTLAINYQMHGTEVWGYHAGNLLIHFCAALCLFGVVRRTLLGMAAGAGANVAARPAGPLYRGNETWLAWAVAALWALHPMQVESVTYIIQRAESLVGLCYLFTLYAFIRGAGTGSSRWLAASCAGCWLGMAAKEVMATAPLIVLLYDRTFLAGTFREGWARRRWVYVAMVCSWLLLLGLVISGGGRGKTVGYDFITWYDYALMQGPGIVTYLWHAILPVNLVFDYGAILEKRMPVLFGGVVLVLCLVVATGVLLKYRPKVGFLGAWLLVILGPTSSVIPVATQTLAEHRMYLSLACVPLAVVLLVYRFAARRAWAIFSVLVLLLAAMSWDRNRDFRSAVSIWEDTVEKVPDNIRAFNNLGVEYISLRRYDDAIRVLREALQISEKDMRAQSNLGVALIQQIFGQQAAWRAQKDWPENIRHPSADLSDNSSVSEGLARLKLAAESGRSNAHTQGTYGAYLMQVGRIAEAMPYLERAVELEPRKAVYRLSLAEALVRQDRLEEAQSHYESPVVFMRDDRLAWLIDYGCLLKRQRNLGAAAEKFKEATGMAPESALAHCNLGGVLLEMGHATEGISELRRAYQLDPKFPKTLYHLFNAFADTNRPGEAIPFLEELVAISPPSAELQSNLGVLYARVGRIGDAILQTRKALEIDPGHEAAQENLARLLAYSEKNGTK